VPVALPVEEAGAVVPVEVSVEVAVEEVLVAEEDDPDSVAVAGSLPAPTRTPVGLVEAAGLVELDEPDEELDEPDDTAPPVEPWPMGEVGGPGKT